VRDVCVFARQDVTRDPPFSRLELILCRNVLIYLSAPLQRRLMTVFHYALRPGRFLVLGHAETIGTYFDLFQLEDRQHRIYVKKGVELPLDGASWSTRRRSRTVQHAVALPPRDDLRLVQNEANRLLLDRFAPAGAVIDDEMQIIHFRGADRPIPRAGGRRSEPAPAQDGARRPAPSAAGAINEARLSGRPSRQDGVRMRQNGGWRHVSIEVVPLSAAAKRHFLVLFRPVERRRARRATPPVDAPLEPPAASADERVRTLEDELAASRTYLQSIIQELEAANEELQSANEEILSSNEELQSTNEELDTAKEELQSTNEELNTVNDELHGGTRSSAASNGDLMNVLSTCRSPSSSSRATCASAGSRRWPSAS
jgi:two-component system CheB/CheR fusion protein